MASALGVRRGGAQLDGLGLVEDDGGQRLLPQRQHVQLGLQHGLEVLGGGQREGGGRNCDFLRDLQSGPGSDALEVSVFAPPEA